MEALAVKPVAPFGATVKLSDARSPSASDREKLSSLLSQHDLLVFRGVYLSMDGQIGLLSTWGAVLKAEHSVYDLDPELRPENISTNHPRPVAS